MNSFKRKTAKQKHVREMSLEKLLTRHHWLWKWRKRSREQRAQTSLGANKETRTSVQQPQCSESNSLSAVSPTTSVQWVQQPQCSESNNLNAVSPTASMQWVPPRWWIGRNHSLCYSLPKKHYQYFDCSLPKHTGLLT